MSIRACRSDVHVQLFSLVPGEAVAFLDELLAEGGGDRRAGVGGPDHGRPFLWGESGVAEVRRSPAICAAALNAPSSVFPVERGRPS